MITVSNSFWNYLNASLFICCSVMCSLISVIRHLFVCQTSNNLVALDNDLKISFTLSVRPFVIVTTIKYNLWNILFSSYLFQKIKCSERFSVKKQTYPKVHVVFRVFSNITCSCNLYLPVCKSRMLPKKIETKQFCKRWNSQGNIGIAKTLSSIFILHYKSNWQLLILSQNWYFLGVKKFPVMPTEWDLGNSVLFKISYQHPCPFYMGDPSLGVICQLRVKKEEIVIW